LVVMICFGCREWQQNSMISHLHPCQTQPSRLYQTHIVTLCDILANIHLTFDLAFHLTHFLPYPDNLSDICPSTVLKIHHGREASTVIHITPFSAHLTQFSGTAAALPLSPSPAQINRLFLKPSYFRSCATPYVKPPNCRRTKRCELRDPSKGRDDIHNIDSARPEV